LAAAKVDNKALGCGSDAYTQMLTPTTHTTKYKQHKKAHGSIFTIKK
jgi:hypothetical protein